MAVKKVALGAALLFLVLASLSGAQDKPVIAVVDFRSLGLDEFVGQTIAEIIRTELIGTGKFKVLERGALQKVLEEQQLSMSGVADEQTAVRVGRLVGAKFIMVGSISKLGDNYILNSRLVDVESGEAVQGKSFQGRSENELPSMARQLVLSVVGRGEVKPEEVGPKEEPKKDEIKVIPSTGSAYITSEPTGAKVVVDRVEKGTTPLTVRDLSIGDHAVELTLKDYEKWVGKVEIKANQVELVEAKLSKETGSIMVISTPPRAEIYVDGKLVGTTPATVDRVEIGEREVRIKRSGFREYVKRVAAIANLTTTVETTLEAIATLTVRANVRGASVYVDGVYRGTTDLDLALSSGSYKVKVAKEGYNDYETTVSISAGDSGSVYASLEKVPTTETFFPITREPTGEKDRTLAYTSLGVGIISVGGAVLTYFLGEDAYRRHISATTYKEAKSAYDESNSLKTAALVLSGVSGFSLTITIFTW
jgi:TolB-like protein